MNHMELTDIMHIIDIYKDKYEKFSGYLRIKNITPLNEKTGQVWTTMEICEKVIEDLRSLANVIYDNSKRY
ncbi:MAG: hypothetical protein PHI16_01270 [Methanocellales archaeon]|nr:hypothetical protein [Methanocellales archaeon]